jgi:copper chaperone CopZ
MFKSILLTSVLVMAAAVAQAGTIEMKVNGLVCAFCARGIEKTLHKNPAVADVVVSLEDKLVAVQMKVGTDISDQDLRATLTDAGYDIKSIERTDTPVAAIRERLKSSVK